MNSQPHATTDHVPGRPLRLLVTGGTGVLGRALRPLAEAAGHQVAMPGHEDLDLFDPVAVADAVRDVDAVLHLATRIRAFEQISDPDAWHENDRLRSDASRILVDAAIAAGTSVYVQPTVTFVYPSDARASEDTPVGEVLPILRSALVAERETERFASSGGRGVVLRLGLLDGPGTGNDLPMDVFGATLHVTDAARALLAALTLPSGTYNVCRDGERISNERFTRAVGWHPGDVGGQERPSLQERCDLLRSLHVPGTPLLFPNVWDVATARAVVAAGHPAVATTSGGVAATLGYADHEAAPAEEMLAAARRIARGVDVPVTIDAESGYGMEPAELVDALRTAEAAGCNLEDTDHAACLLRDPDEQAEWLRVVRRAATDAGYPLVINARVDVFLVPFFSGANAEALSGLIPEAVERANAYLEAGADCVYPIGLWEKDAIGRFVSEVPGPVNVIRIPQTPPLAELAELGVARVSWATLLHREAMAHFDEQLASLQ